jgi:hypothetical protein
MNADLTNVTTGEKTDPVQCCISELEECSKIMQEFHHHPTKEKFMRIVNDYLNNKQHYNRIIVKKYEVWISSVIVHYPEFNIETDNNILFKFKKIIDINTDFYRHYVQYLFNKKTMNEVCGILDLMWIIFCTTGDKYISQKILRISKDTCLNGTVREVAKVSYEMLNSL